MGGALWQGVKNNVEEVRGVNLELGASVSQQGDECKIAGNIKDKGRLCAAPEVRYKGMDAIRAVIAQFGRKQKLLNGSESEHEARPPLQRR